MLIYISEPIDRMVDHSIAWWKWEWASQYVLYLPRTAFSVAERISCRTASRIARINMLALENCNAVVMRYCPGVESWGVPMELSAATKMNIPVFVYIGSGIEVSRLPIYLRAMVPDERCGSLPEISSMLEKLSLETGHV